MSAPPEPAEGVAEGSAVPSAEASVGLFGGRWIGITRQRGFSNEEAMSYLRSILDALSAVKLMAPGRG